MKRMLLLWAALLVLAWVIVITGIVFVWRGLQWWAETITSL